jgi:hypothetical protein
MFGTDWAEVIDDDEEGRFNRVAELLARVQAAQDARYAEKGRALHRQAHAGVDGRFVVRADLGDVLPAELHVGPFQPGADWPVLVRFSNGGFVRTRKDPPDVRGVALKLLGVPGARLLNASDAQDFLLNHTPSRPARTVEEFAALIEAAAPGGTFGTVWRLIGLVGFWRAITLVQATLSGMKAPFPGYAGGAFWSMSPFRLGPAAARFSLVGEPTAGSGTGTLAGELARRLAEGARWTFRVQLYQDAVRTPIEDATLDWQEPWIDVATLTVPPTDPGAARSVAVAALVERLAFDPWHAVEELRPLGAFNRARKTAYFVGSVRQRDVVRDADIVIPGR